MLTTLRLWYYRLVGRILDYRLARIDDKLRARGMTEQELTYLDARIRARLVDIYGKEKVDHYYEYHRNRKEHAHADCPLGA